MSPKHGARRRATRIAVVSIFAFAALCGGARAASEAPGATFAASVTAGGELAETGVGQRVAISADGRFVAFVSDSANLSPDATAWDQAYVKDLDSGALTLASRATGGEGEPAEEPRGGGVERVYLSASGRYLAFETSSENLSPDLPSPPPVAVTHVYRRDLATGATEIVDRVDGAGGEVLPTQAHVLAISPDGDLVAFADRAEGLGEPMGAQEGEETIYVRDLASGTTTEVAAEGAEEAAFSGDGRYLLFTSPATDLSPEANGEYQVYRRDLQTGETVLVSRGNPTGAAPEGEPADGEAFEASFVGTSDCRVAFLAVGTSDLTPGGEDPAEGVYLRDFCATPSTKLVSLREDGEPFEEVFWPSATDGGEVVFEGENGFPDVRHLYLWDPGTGETTVLDRASGEGGEPADRAVVGGARVAVAGCRALFVSEADNLLGEEAALPGQQALVRQLTPCKQGPADKGGSPAAGGPAPGAGSRLAGAGRALAKSVAVSGLGRRALSLTFDGAGRARVRIQRLWSNGRGNWKLVRSFVVEASAPGAVRTTLPQLAPGRYRLRLRLQGDPDNPTLSRRLAQPSE
jgi:Tol biopolymer transport system component